MQEIETRYTHSPEDIRHYSTEQLRVFSRKGI